MAHAARRRQPSCVSAGNRAPTKPSTGDNVLTGRSFHVAAGGVKADLQHGAATLTVAYTQTGRGEAYRSPYGTWAGYTSMIVEDFNRAGETAWLARRRV